MFLAQHQLPGGCHENVGPQWAADQKLHVISSGQGPMQTTGLPAENIFRFPNKFLNSWLNASFQTILDLSVTRSSGSVKGLYRRSSIPRCANLTHSAVRHPGKHFSPKEISLVLIELREKTVTRRGERVWNKMLTGFCVGLSRFIW